MKSLPVTALLMTLLSGCSLFQVHTNLDKENFTEYFKPGSVNVLDKAQILDANATSIGTVEGESCQSKDIQAPPNISDAQTDARRKVADKGGNAVVFGKCISMPATTECVASMVCYGQAYKVKDSE
jgi:RcsF protein